MSELLKDVLKANAEYAANFGDKGNLPMPPGRRLAILTCMDARLDPAAFAGIAEGDAHVIRNAGGRASDDAIRSLVISYTRWDGATYPIAALADNATMRYVAPLPLPA